MHNDGGRFHLSISCVKGVQTLQEAYAQNGKQLRMRVSTETALQAAHTPKNIPDSRNIRATQICMVPTYLSPSNTVTSSIQYQQRTETHAEGEKQTHSS
jgi:hypothetical protein